VEYDAVVYTTRIIEEHLEDGHVIGRSEFTLPWGSAAHQIATPADAFAELKAQRAHTYGLIDALARSLGRERTLPLDNAVVNLEAAVRRDAAARIIAAVAFLVSEDEPQGIWLVPPVTGEEAAS
jgi:hypothetical protein